MNQNGDDQEIHSRSPLLMKKCNANVGTYCINRKKLTGLASHRKDGGPLFAGALRQGVILNEEFSHKIV